jgi:hypothetical protein
MNLRKLKAKRVDAIAYESNVVRHNMRDMGIDPSQYETVFTLKMVSFILRPVLEHLMMLLHALQDELDP